MELSDILPSNEPTPENSSPSIILDSDIYHPNQQQTLPQQPTPYSDRTNQLLLTRVEVLEANRDKEYLARIKAEKELAKAYNALGLAENELADVTMDLVRKENELDETHDELTRASQKIQTLEQKLAAKPGVVDRIFNFFDALLRPETYSKIYDAMKRKIEEK